MTERKATNGAPPLISQDEAITLLSAIVRLDSALQQANEYYLQRHQFQDGGRRAAVVAMMGAYDFIQTYKEWRDKNFAMPFALIEYALRDLEKGTVAPILKPKKAANRPRAPQGHEAIRGLAAATMSILILLGAEVDIAAKRVANVIRKATVPVKEEWRKVTAVTVKGWREKILEGGGQAKLVYQTIMEKHKQEMDDPKNCIVKEYEELRTVWCDLRLAQLESAIVQMAGL
jgi:hypothetical protein